MLGRVDGKEQERRTSVFPAAETRSVTTNDMLTIIHHDLYATQSGNVSRPIRRRLLRFHSIMGKRGHPCTAGAQWVSPRQAITSETKLLTIKETLVDAIIPYGLQ